MSKTVIVDRRKDKKPANIIHDETEAMTDPDHGQRDDREATMPAEDIRSSHPGLYDGWRWDKDDAGRDIVVPTKDNEQQLLEFVQVFFDDRETRETLVDMDSQLPKTSDLHAGLGTALAQLRKFSTHAATSFLYGQLFNGSTNYVKSMNFVKVYQAQYDRAADKGEDSAMNAAEEKREESRAQALAAASIIDWVLDSDETMELKLDIAVHKFLLQQGEWHKNNTTTSNTQKRQRQSALDYMLNRVSQSEDEEATA